MTRDSKSLSQARYSQFAEGYVTSETHAHGSDLERLLAIAQPRKHWQALDVATGGGHTALKFAPHVEHVIASDLTPRMLESARRFIAERGMDNVSFRQADAENLPFDREQFDLVCCRIAPHHFPDAQRFLLECARVLKSGGLLMLQDHLLPFDDQAARYIDAFERLRDPSHNRAFNQVEWTQMCVRAGFTVEYSEGYRKAHDFLSWARRQEPDAATIAGLIDRMRSAPPIARDWMNPQHWGSPLATFENRHILIRARAS
ncbi:MAG: methyltransferase domain-containing protein [Chloroflexi bacterium]|nr:methyltransferase domain-containing protein [Chloroflexota bacterium]MCY4248629.1 methyltransferase domain-containing protein [Chloroflexota bacterium]